jgi:hypothetical protein
MTNSHRTQMGLLITLASLQLLAMLWASSTHAGDFWEGYNPHLSSNPSPSPTPTLTFVF